MKKTSDQQHSAVDEEKEQLKQQVEDLKTKYLRALADYQNVLRRFEDERKEIYSNIEKDLITNLIPIADLFDEVLKHDPYKSDQGLRAVRVRLADVLHGYGVEGRPVVGKPFNPALMECVDVREPQGKEEENDVIEEINKLYLHRDKLFRPARVIVAKHKDI